MRKSTFKLVATTCGLLQVLTTVIAAGEYVVSDVGFPGILAVYGFLSVQNVAIFLVSVAVVPKLLDEDDTNE
jgi:hypothetical protein